MKDSQHARAIERFDMNYQAIKINENTFDIS